MAAGVERGWGYNTPHPVEAVSKLPLRDAVPVHDDVLRLHPGAAVKLKEQRRHSCVKALDHLFAVALDLDAGSVAGAVGVEAPDDSGDGGGRLGAAGGRVGDVGAEEHEGLGCTTTAP